MKFNNIMMKRILILFALVFLSQSLLADNNKAMIDSANHFYTKGKYEKAIKYYEQVLENGYESAGLYYNLGNAYYKSHKIASAILNYERARLRDPGNEDIKYNLQLARKQITDDIEAIPEFFISKWIRQFIQLFGSDAWAITSMITFVGFLILLALSLFSKRFNLKRTFFWLSLVLMVLSFSTFYFSHKQKQNIVSNEKAIVFSSKVTVKSTPAKSGTDLFVIHEGLKVKILREVGDWYEIKLADGNVGWIQKEDVEEI